MLVYTTICVKYYGKTCKLSKTILMVSGLLEAILMNYSIMWIIREETPLATPVLVSSRT